MRQHIYYSLLAVVSAYAKASADRAPSFVPLKRDYGGQAAGPATSYAVVAQLVPRSRIHYAHSHAGQGAILGTDGTSAQSRCSSAGRATPW